MTVSGTTMIGKDQNQLEASLAMGVTENGERLTLKWMLSTVDYDVLEMGSVWIVPWVRWSTN